MIYIKRLTKDISFNIELTVEVFYDYVKQTIQFNFYDGQLSK